MQTKLLEFSNNEGNKLRGILTLPDGEIKKSVICLHGFERCSTTEKKFKILADEFSKKAIATLRFDFSGCGLSDGDFRFTTIGKQGGELLKAIEVLKEKTNCSKINVVAHSLGSSVIADQINNLKKEIEKIVLISPALNQKDLLRYWFVFSKMKKNDSNILVTWMNYKEFFNEMEFQKDCIKNGKITKMNYIDPEYFLFGKDIDFSDSFANIDNVLHIHGVNDSSVPIESLNFEFSNRLIIEGGDHDLEKPNIMLQWLRKVVDYISR